MRRKQRRVRVAFVNQPWVYPRPPHPAGSLEIWTYEVARRLAARCDVTVYGGSSRYRGTSFVDGGVRYRLFPTAPDALLRRLVARLVPHSSDRRPLLASLLHYVLYALAVGAALRRTPVDVIHVQNQFPFVRLLRRLCPEPRIVLHMHSEWLSQLDPAVTRPAVAAADRVVGCSEHITERVREAHPAHAARCRTVHNGVDLEAFTPYGPRADDGRMRLAYVGRVSPEKGVHVLLEAFARAAERRADVELTIAGPLAVLPEESLVRLSDDPRVRALASFYTPGAEDYLTYLQHLVPEQLRPHVRFTGQLSRTEVQAVYRGADMLVNPSLSESFGMSLVEAMAAGLPVIATRAGGQPEVVEPGRTGLLVEAGDADALAEVMLALADDPQRRAAMGRAGRARAEACFSWDHIADDAYAVYEELAGSRA